ncbi:hypothetical protein OGAPHI_000642 [Ogataea philodendri]|uniref:USP domain-containing protein n=1 Tax=Ogataea philodendri TaxID=1378263 RepID=A0A9P8PFF5_9ASCO|nr:uncharacterized protein OGAPHI_000642 [Ogataea philodendri]KAH3670931.1 hypothetical protein OGAPHI_000642 [Ogataea philodendri]
MVHPIDRLIQLYRKESVPTVVPTKSKLHYQSISLYLFVFSVGIYVLLPSLIPSAYPTTMFSKRPDRLTTGLINMTTDCFANCCLQALAALPGLNEYLNAMTEFRNAKQQEGVQLPAFTLHLALISMVSKLQETIYHSRVLSVWDFLHVIEKIYKSKISMSQHDAQELLQLILETLEREHHQLRKVAAGIPDFPFRSEVASQLRCMKCGRKSSTQYNPMMIVSLPVPQEASIDLESMLKGSENDIIDYYSCVRCKITHIINTVKEPDPIVKKLQHRLDQDLLINDDLEPELEEYIKNFPDIKSDSIKTTVHKETSIIDPPKLLTLHLSRSIYDTQARRNSCNVDFKEFLTLKVDTAEMDKYKVIKKEEEERSDDDPPQLRRAISSILEEKPGSEYLEDSGVHSDHEEEQENEELVSDEEELEDEDDDEDDVASRLAAQRISETTSDTLVNDDLKTIHYRLYAAVRHQGSHSLGHYECYRRKPVFYKNSVTGEYYQKFPKLDTEEATAGEGPAVDIRRQTSMSRLRSRVSSLVGATRPRSPSLVEPAPTSVIRDKKLASSVKQPFWRVNDSKVSECSVSDLLEDSRAVLPETSRVLGVHQLRVLRIGLFLGQVLGTRLLELGVGNLDQSVELFKLLAALVLLELGNRLRVLLHPFQVLGVVKHRLRHLHLEVSVLSVLRELVEVFLGNRIELDLVERSQQPWVTRVGLGSVRSQGKLVPQRQRSSNKLVATRRVHGVDTHVHSSDTNNSVRSEGSGRVVLGSQESVSWVQWHGTWCSQENVSQTQNQESGSIQHVLHGRSLDAVDLSNEVHVVRKLYHTALDRPLVGESNLGLISDQSFHQSFLADLGSIVFHQNRSHTLRHLDNSNGLVRVNHLNQLVHSVRQVEVHNVLTVFDQDVSVTSLSIGDNRSVRGAGWLVSGQNRVFWSSQSFLDDWSRTLEFLDGLVLGSLELNSRVKANRIELD